MTRTLKRITTRKPRNPYVAVSLMRRAGSHRRCASAQRQHADRALRAELTRGP